ncbi:FecR family protein [Echinicola soli]|nr:FecR family protein [Echinicola soli]
MEFDPESELDFLKNPLFVKWVKQPTQHTDRYWENWSRKYPEKINVMLNAKELAKRLKPQEENKIDKAKFEAGLDRLLEKNNNELETPSPTFAYKRKESRHFWTWGNSVAASILLIGMLFMAYNWINRSTGTIPTTKNVAIISRTVSKGVKKTFMLPDSSMVTLNSGSTISYPKDFAENRQIKLVGQAFFDVKNDSDHPFSIKSGDLVTTVLGTSFDVKAYEGQSNFHVAVVTGKVKVATQDGIETEIVPTEATYYDAESGAISKGKYDYEELLGWKEKILKFDDASYREVFRILSNWYDVDFELDSEFTLKGNYTGRFEDQMLENVLKGMEYSTDIQFELKGKKVMVSKKSTLPNQ